MYKIYDLGIHTSEDSNEVDVDLSNIDFNGVSTLTATGQVTRLSGTSSNVVIRPVSDFAGNLTEKVYLPYTSYVENLGDDGFCIQFEPIVPDLNIRFKISTASNRIEARVFVIAHYTC